MFAKGAMVVHRNMINISSMFVATRAPKQLSHIASTVQETL